MMRIRDGGQAIAVEIWSVPAAGLARSSAEPAALYRQSGTRDGREVLGVLGEPWL
jgi:hypothetical protein